jgi:hypothetical protein
MILLLLLLGACLIVLFGFVPPIPQDLAYHRFAPTSVEITGIPNTWNVMTNLPFAVVGLLGLLFCSRTPHLAATASWKLFFTGVTLTSIGSAYYHWQPTSATLVWDRLPMTIAFTSLFSALLSEQFSNTLERFILVPMVVLGLSSVLYWQQTNDLRFYAMVQFFPMVALPTMSCIMPFRHGFGRYLYQALAAYALAKVFETCDQQTWKLLGFSGHAIKHLLAGYSTFCLLLMLKSRQHPMQNPSPSRNP